MTLYFYLFIYVAIVQKKLNEKVSWFYFNETLQQDAYTVNNYTLITINAMRRRKLINEMLFHNLVGESLSLFNPLSCVLKLLLNKSFANDLVLTSGDFSECSDSELSCSELTERPL